MSNLMTLPDGKLAEIGRIATPVHAGVDVEATSTAVLPADAGRAYALFINDSDTTLYLSLDGEAAAAQAGIRLNAGGGFYEMSAGCGNLSHAAVRAIHAGSGAKRLLVTTGKGV